MLATTCFDVVGQRVNGIDLTIAFDRNVVTIAKLIEPDLHIIAKGIMAQNCF